MDARQINRFSGTWYSRGCLKKKEEKSIKQSFINTLFITCLENPETPAFTWLIKFCCMWCNEQLSISPCIMLITSTNGHFFRPGGQKIHTLTLVLNQLSTTATTPQRPLSSVPKVTIVERFNCNFSLYGEYNMAARRYEISLLVLKNISTPMKYQPFHFISVLMWKAQFIM